VILEEDADWRTDAFFQLDGYPFLVTTEILIGIHDLTFCELTKNVSGAFPSLGEPPKSGDCHSFTTGARTKEEQSPMNESNSSRSEASRDRKRLPLWGSRNDGFAGCDARDWNDDIAMCIKKARKASIHPCC